MGWASSIFGVNPESSSPCSLLQGPQVDNRSEVTRSDVIGNSLTRGLPTPCYRGTSPHGGIDQHLSIGSISGIEERSPSPRERGTALSSALEHTTFRLEKLHERLKELSPMSASDWNNCCQA